MTEAWARARLAFESFEDAWSRAPGAPRSKVVRLAFAADDAIEPLWDLDLTESQQVQMDHWLDVLGRVPDVEKRWMGLAEYSREHRIKQVALSALDGDT